MPNNSFESYIEQIPTGTASTLQDLEKVVNGILATVPKLDRDALRYEMGEMVVEMSTNPTTFKKLLKKHIKNDWNKKISPILNLLLTIRTLPKP